MKLDVNKEQLEILKYAVLWYECNDKKEEELIEQLEEKLYNAQEEDILQLISSQNVI